MPNARTSMKTSHPIHLADASTATARGPEEEVRSPFDESVIGVVATSTPDDLDDAFRTARRVQHAWAQTPVASRVASARRFARLVLAEQARILDHVQVETGKSRSSAFEEVLDVARASEYFARIARPVLRERRRPGAIPFLTRTRHVHHPKGVVGVISPWNYPFTLTATDSLPALLAGNAVVVKPDSQTPFTALLVKELLERAGFPRDLLQVVIGEGARVGPELIARSDFIMFTGSTRTGKRVAAACADRLIDFSAELGGKNPLLVLEDADPERAAAGAVRAAFANTGQLCVSIERIYVHARIHDRFLRHLASTTKALTLGAGLDWSHDVGSLASRAQLDTVERHVADAVDRGATVVAGGRARPDLGPFFYEPTVLVDVPPSALLATEETFGPVVAVYQVDSDAEALERANDSAYGLNASVWTSSSRRGWALARKVQTGTVNINEGYTAAWGSHASPMGGWKQSGVGRRHGETGLLKYTESQTIAEQRVMPIAPPPGMTAPQWAATMTRAVRAMRAFRL